MEVRIDATGAQAAPPETFVSVRIGDIQKQSRFADCRTYKFPDPGRGRENYGRIEVFKRIGHLTVRFEDLEGAEQDVEVPVEFPGLKKLRMRMSVLGTQGGGCVLPPVAGQAKARTPKAKSKREAAQRYLDEHNVEELLAEAMRELIHNKPRDPHAFLSSHILKRGESSANLNAAPQQSYGGDYSLAKNRSRPGTRDRLRPRELPPLGPPGPEDGPPPEPYAARGPYEEEGYEKCVAPGEDLDEAMEKAVAKPVGFAGGFGFYYQENFLSLPAGSLKPLYSKFKPAPKVDFNASRGKAELANFRGYYTHHFAAPEGPTSLYANFKSAPRIVFKTPQAAGSLQGPGFRSLPSVGTWLGKPRKVVAPQASASSSAGKPVPPVSFQFKPSVGTWLAPKPIKLVPPVPFEFRPSVGTWLARPARLPPGAGPAKKAPIPWARQPSVGTWLAYKPFPTPHPPKVTELPKEKLKAMKLDELMATVLNELAEKDKEIHDLKEMVKQLLQHAKAAK